MARPADMQVGIEPTLVNSQNVITDAGRVGALAGENFVRKFQQPLGRITGNASEFEKSMSASNARVLAFTASAGGLYVIVDAFKKLVQSTIQVEKELANINLYMNLGSNSLKAFSANLFSIATKTATPFQDAAKAAMEFTRQGLTMNEVLKRTSDALSLSRLTGMGMEDAITDLTSIMNSFNKESLNTTMIVDRLSSVGGKFAVSADAIAEALKRVGSSASDAGVGFDQMISLITSTQHITGRAASVIGTSFNTIFTRLQRPKVLEDLETVGVQVRNTSGAMLPMMDVIKNLANRYETLSSSQKSFISETVGGVRQLNTLKALFMDLGGGYSIYGRAMDAAANSTGIAQKRISDLNQTISAQLQQTATSWQQVLSNIGNIVISPIIKGGTKGLTNIGKNAAEITNPNSGGTENTLLQGTFKTLGNVLAGPGLQAGATIIYKLFDKLLTFGKDAYKDISGLSQITQQRAAIEKGLVNSMMQESSVLKTINAETTTLLEKTQKIAQLRQSFTLQAQGITGELMKGGQIGSVYATMTGQKVPNAALPDSISKALQRENIATHGNAKLSSDPSLISSSNPLGLVAIDSRIQGNAAQAIRQHMSLGQSLNDIKSGNTNKVPNLAMMDTMFMASSLMGIGSGMMGTHENIEFMLQFKRAIGMLTDSLEKQIYTVNKLSKVQDDLAAGKTIKPFTLPGDKTVYNPKTTSEFESKLKDKIVLNGQTLETQRANLQEQRRNSAAAGQSLGFRLSLGAALGGGMLSTMLQQNSPNAARGTEKLFGGLELAGQAKMFFPRNKFGNIAAGAFAGQGIADFIKELTNGTAGLEADFAKQQEKVQKVNSSLDALIQSVSNLDQMALDSSVSFEALTREQRKYSDTLNQFQGSGATFEQIQNVRNAPNSKSRMRAIEDIRESYNDNLENQALNLSLKQANNERGGFLGIGRKSLFGYSDKIEQEQQSGFINDVAGRALVNMSTPERNKFEKEVMNRNINSNLGINNIYGEKNAGLRGFFSNQNKDDQATLMEQIKFLATQSFAEKNPAVRQARLDAINKNQEIGLPLDMATRQEEMLKKLFINSTAMNVNNTIQKSLIGQGVGFAGESIGLAGRQGMAGILGLTAGQKTNIEFQRQSESMRADLEMRKKLATSNAGFTSKLSAPYTQSVAEWVTENKDTFTPGGNAQGISDTVRKFTESINKGLVSTVSQNNGNLSGFIGRNGQLDVSGLNKSILNNSGLTQGTNEYNNLSKFLTSNAGSEEQLKEINAHLVENTNITMEGNQAIVEANIKAQAALREYQIQMNSSILGGISAFQHPGEGMGIMSQYVRSTALMNSANPIMAGRGAIGALQWMKQNSGQDVQFGNVMQNGLYKETGSDNLTNKQSSLANTFLRGYYQNQQRMIGRMNPNDPLTQEMQRNMMVNGKPNYGIGRDALESALHPERATSSPNVSSQIDTFKHSLDSVIEPINNFDSSLDGLASKINALHFEINRPGGTRDIVTQGQANNNAVVTAAQALAGASGSQNPTGNTGGETSWGQNALSWTGDHAGGIAGGIALALGLGRTKFGRGLLSKGYKGIKSGISNIPKWIPKRLEIPGEKEMSQGFQNIPSTPYTSYEHAPIYYPTGNRGLLLPEISESTRIANMKTFNMPHKIPVSWGGTPESWSTRMTTVERQMPSMGNVVKNPVMQGSMSDISLGKAVSGGVPAFGGSSLFSLGLGGMIGQGVSEAGGGNGVGGFIGGSLMENALMKGGKLNFGANAVEGGVGKLGAVGAVISSAKFGWDAGMAINDRYIGSNDRKAAFAAMQNQQLLNDNPYLNQIQRLRGSISNIQYQEGQTKSDRGLTAEQKEKRINSSEAAIKQLNDSINALKDQYAKAASPNQNGGTPENTANIPLNISIDLKNPEAIPGIIDEKLIKPLVTQLASMSAQISELQRRLNISPNPSRVS